MPDTTDWYRDWPTVLDVAQHAIDQGELRSAQEAIDFCEKPWHYPELQLLWRRSQGNDDFPYSCAVDAHLRECVVCGNPVPSEWYAHHWNTVHIGIAIPRASSRLTTTGRLIQVAP